MPRVSLGLVGTALVLPGCMAVPYQEKNEFRAFLPGGGSGPPFIKADIHLIKKPFEAQPPTRFDADSLIAALAPIVNGPKCDRGNVCPHVHRYLGQTDSTAKPQPQ